jgi:hypothetical protein
MIKRITNVPDLLRISIKNRQEIFPNFQELLQNFEHFFVPFFLLAYHMRNRSSMLDREQWKTLMKSTRISVTLAVYFQVVRWTELEFWHTMKLINAFSIERDEGAAVIESEIMNTLRFVYSFAVRHNEVLLYLQLLIYGRSSFHFQLFFLVLFADWLHSPTSESTRIFGTSPQINRFLAREPPDGCERVQLKIVEEVR